MKEQTVCSAFTTQTLHTLHFSPISRTLASIAFFFARATLFFNSIAMLSTMKARLPVDKVGIFALKIGSSSSGKAVLGAGGGFAGRARGGAGTTSFVALLIGLKRSAFNAASFSAGRTIVGVGTTALSALATVRGVEVTKVNGSSGNGESTCES
jgi:hypothetical protein